MRNGGVENPILPSNTNRRDPIVRAQARFERGLGFLARRATILRRGFEPYGVSIAGVSIDDQNGEFGRSPDDNDGVAPAAFAGDRKPAAD
jgi:hypothetical protein